VKKKTLPHPMAVRLGGQEKYPTAEKITTTAAQPVVNGLITSSIRSPGTI
jgi:hypothetical protein